MTSKTFSLEARVLECKNCGGPLQVPVTGGQARCEYCGMVTQVAPRRDLRVAVPPPEAQAPGDGSEQQRLFVLHQQQAQYSAATNPYAFHRAPPGLESVASQIASLGFGHQNAPGVVQPLFQQAVAAAAAAPHDPVGQRRLYWLAMVISQVWAARNDYLRQRAALETALELLHDPGYRYILNTEMAKAARNMGDLDAAEAWLSLCAPDPWNLDLDSAYRTTAASLALGRRQWDRALSLVGRNRGEIPFDPSRDMLAGVIRTAALEGMGDQAGAEQALRATIEAHGRDDVKKTLEASESVAPGRVTYERLAARKALPRGPIKVGGFRLRGGARIGVFGSVAFTLLALIPALVIPFCPSSCGSVLGYQDVVMDRLRSCPAAQQLLGEDIHTSTIGLSCGNAEVSGSSGHASWRMPVEGSRASGTYQFVVTKAGGPWQIQSAVLTVDGQTIDVANCPVAMEMPAGPTATSPGAPGGAPQAGGACDRMQSCCSATGSDPTMAGICGSVPQLRATPNAEAACSQLLQTARQVLQARGNPVPPQCQ